MANYRYDLRELHEDDYSFFTARIEPPIFPLPDIYVENNIFDGMEIKHYVTTESASVYRVDIEDNARDFPLIDRTKQTVKFLSGLMVLLNGIETNDASIWASGESKVYI